MLNAAPPLRARPLASFADTLWAARGGLGGGEGIPEPTSGIPLGPASPRSGVVEAVKRRRSGVHNIGTGVHIGSRPVAAITTTTTASFTGHRHFS